MNTIWAKPPDIVAFTGGALAREAGFAPFDPATMPAGLRLEDVVTRDGFARDPDRVNAFYNRRRRELMQARPSAAHDGLAVLETMRPRQVLIVTRNIDDLHERAGSKAVIHTHGELLKARCTICTNLSDRAMTTSRPTPPVRSAAMPGICVPVSSGSARSRSAWRASTRRWRIARLFLAIGVPIAAEPANGFADAARRADARRIAFTPDLSPTPVRSTSTSPARSPRRCRLMSSG